MEKRLRHIFTIYNKYGVVLFCVLMLFGYIYFKKCAGVFYFCTHGIMVERFDMGKLATGERIEPDLFSASGKYRVDADLSSATANEIRVYDVDTGATVSIFSYQYAYALGSRTWIDDTHIYATRGCGTACTVLVLLDVSTGKASEALMMHIPVRKFGSPVGYFRDWLGVEHWFDVVMKDIEIMRDKGQTKLVFILFDPKTDSEVGMRSYYFDEITGQ